MLSPILAATLIVAMPASDGLVVCADRRAVQVTVRNGSQNTRVSDSYRKLLPAGDKGVFSITGQPEARNQEGATALDFRQLVTDGIRKYGSPSLNGLQSFAQKALIEPLVSTGALSLLAPPEVPSEWLFQISFFYYLGSDPIEADIRVFYTKGVDAAPRAEVSAVRFSDADAFSFRGTTLVPREMMSGHDPRFEDLRKAYASFRSEKTPPSKKVLEFEQWLIRESSRRTRELTDAKHRHLDIGMTTDCAEISPTGVRWHLQSDESPSPQHRQRGRKPALPSITGVERAR